MASPRVFVFPLRVSVLQFLGSGLRVGKMFLDSLRLMRLGERLKGSVFEVNGIFASLCDSSASLCVTVFGFWVTGRKNVFGFFASYAAWRETERFWVRG
ncbi:hypothetical protein DMA11_15230 [Marinilabiliaceae bacterium JC017]|nr:hypothetical protein DMA11_15230 [Marinilabiliaceae bacterium JC017]